MKDNLIKNERIALSNLTQRPDFVINKADEGSTIVILTRSDYIHRGMNHLADEATYEPLLEDTSGELKANINHQLHKHKWTTNRTNVQILPTPITVENL